MLKSEMQHQFWITKKTVQRKLGTKEDVHVISSDAELDAKIEIFQSISQTSSALNKIIDQYQEHICVLAHEESTFGRFLKETGKRSKTTGTTITNTGKAVSYCGQQRLCVRVPLLRLQHEVDVFRCRAVRDTQATIQNMEKDRTEYRAALSWMKAASAELDPDTGRGLDKFRTAQSAVRNAKQNFDTSSMDSIQKIDLLAAARCNMFSHALSAYMSELKEFAERTANTYETISKTLQQKPKYDFTVLKELTQNERQAECTEITENLMDAGEKQQDMLDKFQSLFLADDFKDEPEETLITTTTTTTDVNSRDALEHADDSLNMNFEDQQNIDMLGINEQAEDQNIFQLTIDENSANINGSMEKDDTTAWGDFMSQTTTTTPQMPIKSTTTLVANNIQENKKLSQKNKIKGKYNAWLEMFAELDPLANPEAFDLKLNGTSKNIQQT